MHILISKFVDDKFNVYTKTFTIPKSQVSIKFWLLYKKKFVQKNLYDELLICSPAFQLQLVNQRH